MVSENSQLNNALFYKRSIEDRKSREVGPKHLPGERLDGQDLALRHKLEAVLVNRPKLA